MGGREQQIFFIIRGQLIVQLTRRGECDWHRSDSVYNRMSSTYGFQTSQFSPNGTR